MQTTKELIESKKRLLILLIFLGEITDNPKYKEDLVKLLIQTLDNFGFEFFY